MSQSTERNVTLLGHNIFITQKQPVLPHLGNHEVESQNL